MIVALGTARVVTPGTPVAISTLDTGGFGKVHGIMIQALPANVGKVYLGTATMNRAQVTGLFAVLAIPTSNVIQSFSAAITQAPASIQLKDLYLDADNGNDGAIVTVLVA